MLGDEYFVLFSHVGVTGLVPKHPRVLSVIKRLQFAIQLGVPQYEELGGLRLFYNNGYLTFNAAGSDSFNDGLFVLATNSKSDHPKLQLSFQPELAHPHIAFVPEEKMIFVY